MRKTSPDGSGAAAILTLAYAGVLLALVSVSSPRLVGDASEYVAYALAFTHGYGPALSEQAIVDVGRDLSALDPAAVDWDMRATGHRARDGRIEFVHFWLYSASATPFVWLARVSGVDPRFGFTVLNIALLVASFAVSIRRLPVPVVCLIFAGPIVWWADKAHPEALIFALMTSALVAWRERPGLAFVSIGLVAAQVPAFAVFLPLLAGAALIERGERRRDRAFVFGLAAGGLLTAWPVFYYALRFGTFTLLAGATRPHWPSLDELGAVVGDLNIGLVANWPMFAIAVAGAVVLLAVRAPRRLLTLDVIAALVGGLVLLVAFPQIGNLMSGGTPGVSRYAVWLVPLAVPLLVAASDNRPWRRLVLALAVVSVPFCLIRYRPAHEEFVHRPTWVAAWVWRHAPSWSHPLTEVFVRSLGQRELPAATGDCGKLLLVGRGDAQGMWPRPCPPTEVPAACRQPGALCYANRTGRSYQFDPIAGDAGDLRYNPQVVWPRSSETAVRSVMVLVDWWSLSRIPSEPGRILRAWQSAEPESVFDAEGRLLALLTDVEPGASVDVDLSGKVSGVLIDADTGTVIAQPQRDGSSGVWQIPLPQGHRLLVLALARDN